MLHKIISATVLLLAITCVNPAANAQIVTFNTNVGDIMVELFGIDAPESVENFLGYVERGDYDGTIFHRSINNFVIQGGGFETDFSGIPTQDPITNEFGRSNLRGTLAYARPSASFAGTNDSATSQFFFNVTDNPNLDDVDGGFAVFGEVVSGLEIVDAINALQTEDEGAPFNNLPVLDSFDGNTVTSEDLVVINSVTVAAAIPEPSSLFLVSACSLALLTRRRRN